MLANVLQLCFYVFILLTVAGDQVFGAMGKPTPDLVKQLNESKLMFCLVGFFMFA